MSGSKESGRVLFRVVDKRGSRHEITADRMVTDGDVVTFYADDRHTELGSFIDPISAMRDEGSRSAMFVDLTPGEVCVARSRWSLFDWLLFGALAVNTALLVRDQFGFAG